MTEVGAKGTLHREGKPDAEGVVKKIQDGRDSGDHLIEFVDSDSADPDEGPVRRQWFVVRPKGTVENGTLELTV